MKMSVAVLLVGTMAGLAGCAGPANPEAERAAVAAAEEWLALVDAESYDQSWQESASMFRGAVTQEDWGKSMRTFRQPLGENLSRRVASTRYRTSLPGAPDGQYVVIQFRSSFAAKKSAVETVTPMLEPDGQWRVSGYYIK